MKDFKQFLLRGNLVDLAVGIVIGTAFGLVVKALVADLITPIVAAIAGQPNFGTLSFTLNHNTIMYGDFINTVISFVIVAAAVFFFVIKPVTALMKRTGHMPEQEPPRKACPECTTEIPVAATRCPQCTAQLVKSPT